MVLYAVYMNKKTTNIKTVGEESNGQPEHIITIAKLGVVGQGAEVHPIDAKEKEGGRAKGCELTTSAGDKESMGASQEGAEAMNPCSEV